MENCLVTKLKGTVSNDSLLHLGEFNVRLGTVTNGSLSITYATLSNQKIRIIGNGYFGQEGIHEVQTGNAGTQTTFSVYNSDNNSLLCFENAKDISKLTCRNIPLSQADTIPLLLFNKLTYFENQYLPIQISNLKNIEFIASFDGIFNGDVEDLPLGNNGLFITKGVITGDAAKIPDGIILLSQVSANASSLTWSSRDTSKKIIALFNVDLGNYVDTYLNNIANCANPAVSSSYKQIKIFGNRTSASDAAVVTLKSYSYTVVVNNETL